MTRLTNLFEAVAASLDGDIAIEIAGKNALLEAAPEACHDLPKDDLTPLPEEVLSILNAPDAHPVCEVINAIPLPWAPPQTSSNPAYVAVSKPKVHVELLGPGGLVKSDTIRLGLRHPARLRIRDPHPSG